MTEKKSEEVRFYQHNQWLKPYLIFQWQRENVSSVWSSDLHRLIKRAFVQADHEVRLSTDTGRSAGGNLLCILYAFLHIFKQLCNPLISRCNWLNHWCQLCSVHSVWVMLLLSLPWALHIRIWKSRELFQSLPRPQVCNKTQLAP